MKPISSKKLKLETPSYLFTTINSPVPISHLSISCIDLRLSERVVNNGLFDFNLNFV